VYKRISHDTALNAHQHRMKLADSRECVCSQGIEDEDHFFFSLQFIQGEQKTADASDKDIWTDIAGKKVPPQSATHLFVPTSVAKFTSSRCQKILEATFSSLCDDNKAKVSHQKIVKIEKYTFQCMIFFSVVFVPWFFCSWPTVYCTTSEDGIRRVKAF